MALDPGRHELGGDHGRIVIRTFRDGLASQAGHDLTIELTRWTGELSVADGGSPTGLDVRMDLGSMVVRDGTGGLKPLTDRDKREIAVNARKVLGADRNPDATFSARAFEPGNGGGVIAGNLTLAGTTGPVRLEISQPGPDRYLATASVRQTQFGIKPYSAFLGALKVRDSVDVEIEVDLSGPAQDGSAQGSA
jgi:polyisoprenoid-binding protein YceI